MPGAERTKVYFHLHCSTRHPIQVHHSGVKDCKYNVRISAVHRQTASEQGCNNITLKILREYDCIEVKGADNNEIFHETDFFSYSTSTTDLANVGFTVDVSSKTTEDSTLSHLGQGHITPLQLSDSSSGTLIVSLIDKSSQAIGTISVDYLLVKPWHHPLNVPSQQSRCSRGLNSQKKDRALVCGHRGAGESFDTTMPSKYPENTISAFKAAHEMGIDFAEMDVQVSKDNIPVIFHDSTIKLCLESLPSSPSKIPKSNFVEIPLKDLTAEQMKMIKVWEWSEMAANQKENNRNLKRKHEDNTSSSSPSTPDVAVDYMLFPTLEEALCEVSQELGFFIELKYPFQQMYDENIQHLCIDKNQFVDSILQVLFKKAGERRILLGCFDPDICVMCQLKQSRYPVFLITQGQNTIWDPYVDIRARTTEMAVAFAKSENLNGIHIFSSLLFDHPESIEKILQGGLTLIAWGHENDKPEKKKWLEEHGVHCVQVDNIFQEKTLPQIENHENPSCKANDVNASNDQEALK